MSKKSERDKNSDQTQRVELREGWSSGII